MFIKEENVGKDKKQKVFTSRIIQCEDRSKEGSNMTRQQFRTLKWTKSLILMTTDFSNISSTSIKLKKSIRANNPPQCLSFSSATSTEVDNNSCFFFVGFR